MTIREYNKISKEDFLNKFGFEKYKHYKEKYELYKEKIKEMKKLRPGVKIVLHHFNLFDKEYELWNTIPMYQDDHTELHQKIKPFNNGKIWWHKGEEEYFGEECPEGFVKGRCKKFREQRSKVMKGNKFWDSELRKKKIGEAFKGRFIQNDGTKTYRLSEPIVGLFMGSAPKDKGGRKIGSKDKTKRPERTQEHIENLKNAKKGNKWFNNGRVQKLLKTCPEGWKPGMLYGECFHTKFDKR